MEQLLGGNGGDIRKRLNVDEHADLDEVQRALFTALAHWRQRAENPVSSLATSGASRVLVRTCEGLYATLAQAKR